MYNKPSFINHYCHKCRQTHKHESKYSSFQCQRCGTLAYPAKQIQASMAFFQILKKD